MDIFNNKLKEAVALLELWEISSIEDLKKCYRKKVKENHPDLQTGNQNHSRKANMMMRMVNNAKDLIDNYIDLYGLNALIVIISKARDPNCNSEFLNTIRATLVIDPSIVMPKAVTEDDYNKTVSKAMTAIQQSLHKTIDKNLRLRKAIIKAEHILDRTGKLLVEDIIENSDIPREHFPFGQIESASEITPISVYGYRRAIERVGLFRDEYQVVIFPSIISNDFTVCTTDGKPLFAIEKCNSFIEYLIEQGDISFDRALLIRGEISNCNHTRFCSRRDYVLRLYFRKTSPMHFSCTNTINKIISGLEFQFDKFYKLRRGTPYYQYETRELSDNKILMDYLFPHHREVVPVTKRLGMLFCRYDGKRIIFTPSEIEFDYFEEMSNSQEVMCEMVEVIGALCVVTQQMSPMVMEEYLETRGKCHYHIGKNIITLLTLKKTKGGNTGLNFRFYLNSDAVCLYDLQGSTSKEAESEETLKQLKNIGPKMAKNLCSIGIKSKEDIDLYSTEEIILKLVNHGIEVNYQFAYSIEGAKLGLVTSLIPKERKSVIREYLESQVNI